MKNSNQPGGGIDIGGGCPGKTFIVCPPGGICANSVNT